MRVLRVPGCARRLQRSRAIQGDHYAADRVGATARIATAGYAGLALFSAVTERVHHSRLKRPSRHRRLLMSRHLWDRTERRAFVIARLAAVALTVTFLRLPLEALPAAPTNLVAQVSGNLVTLSWTAPTG